MRERGKCEIKDFAPTFAVSLYCFEVPTVAHPNPTLSAGAFICTNSLVKPRPSPWLSGAFHRATPSHRKRHLCPRQPDASCWSRGKFLSQFCHPKSKREPPQVVPPQELNAIQFRA